MFLKSVILLTTFAASSLTMAASRNLCDDLIESGKSTPEQINKCHAKFGQSDHFKLEEQKKKWQSDSEAIAKETDKKNQENIETKKFTAAELEEVGFGKPFFAVRLDYNYSPPKVRDLTESDSLCKYLGYEKSLKRILSGEIYPDHADKNGLIIDKNFLGIISDTPELYRDEKLKFTTRKYVEIICAKVKNRDEVTSKLLKEMEEVEVVMNNEFNYPIKVEASGVNDGARKPAEVKSPFGYKKPYADEPTETKSK